MQKKCHTCKEVKDANLFSRATANKDGLQHQCKSCRKKIDAEYYKSNPKKRNKTVERNEIIKKIIYDYKKERGCKYCDENIPCCLDFHHIKGDKKFNVSQHNHVALHKILAEMNKCDVVCANCHRKLHYGIILGRGGLEP